MLFTADARTLLDFDLAKEVGEALHAAYPGHAWAVYVEGGVLHIRNLRLSGKWGMAVHVAKLGDATARKAKVIRFAGELLERAGWRRGGFEGQPATHLEGARKWSAYEGIGR